MDYQAPRLERLGNLRHVVGSLFASVGGGGQPTPSPTGQPPVTTGGVSGASTGPTGLPNTAAPSGHGADALAAAALTATAAAARHARRSGGQD